jgi:hypothetical protein
MVSKLRWKAWLDERDGGIDGARKDELECDFLEAVVGRALLNALNDVQQVDLRRTLNRQVHRLSQGPVRMFREICRPFPIPFIWPL